MKKILSILLILFALIGCNMMNNPSKKVEEFLMSYQTLSDDVVSDLELSSEIENLSQDNKTIYMDAMQRNYKNLKYEITNEQINGDDAVVTTKIIVYDLYKVMKESNDYLTDNSSEFENNGVYDQNKYREYELKEMLKTNYTVDYTIDFYLTKVDDEWILTEPDNVVKEKIHGIYNYELE